MTESEFNLKIEMLLKSKSTYLDNNIRRFIDELLSIKGITNNEKHFLQEKLFELKNINNSIFAKTLDFTIEKQLKDLVLEISIKFL